MYCTTHDVKVKFCTPYFSSRKIILHRFNVDKNEGESGIGYDMIIAHDLMAQLELLDDFKTQLIQWDGATAPMKEPSGMLEKKQIVTRCARWQCRLQNHFTQWELLIGW